MRPWYLSALPFLLGAAATELLLHTQSSEALCGGPSPAAPDLFLVLAWLLGLGGVATIAALIPTTIRMWRAAGWAPRLDALVWMVIAASTALAVAHGQTHLWDCFQLSFGHGC